jgi:hypothetical protein
MKSALKFTSALVAVLALTATVNAATATASNAATTKKARAAKTAKAATRGAKVAAAAKAPVAKPKVSDVSAAASDVQITETAKLSEVKPLVQAKKWSAGLDAESYSPIAGTNEARTDVETDYTAKTGYKLTDSMTAQAVMEWSTMNGVNGQKAGQVFEDPSLRLSKSDLADLGNGIGLSGQARVYLPLSQASQDAGQITQIRLYGTASREITKALSASLTVSPRIFVQQNDTYLDSANKDAPTNVNTFRVYSSAGVKYAVNDKLAFEQTLGSYQKWKTNTARADYLDAATSAYITVTSWMELNAGIRQSDGKTDMRKNGLSHLYNSHESEYFLIGSFSI